MAINWFAGQTDSPWSNWYMPRPVVTQEDAEEEVAPSEITPVTPYPYPYNMADPHVSGDDDHFSTSIDPVRATRQITDSMMMSLSNIGVNDIEFDSFNAFLNTKGHSDLSGPFSSVDLSEMTDYGTEGFRFKTNDRGQKITALAGAATTPFFGLGVGAAASNRYVTTGPAGRTTRSISESGLGNFFGTVTLKREYDALGKIKTAWSNNGNGTWEEHGMAYTLGNNLIYKEPGSNQWKGINNAGIDQRTAQGLGELIHGRNAGNDLLSKLNSQSYGGTPTDEFKSHTPLSQRAGVVQGYDVNTGSFGADVILSTQNGGYYLDGSFNYKGRKASGATRKDLVQLANSTFNKNFKIATEWMNVSRNTTFDSQLEKIANLEYFVNLSRGVSKTEANKNKNDLLSGKSSTATSTVVTADDERPDDTGGNQQDPESGNDDGYSPGGKGEGRTDYLGGYRAFNRREDSRPSVAGSKKDLPTTWGGARRPDMLQMGGRIGLQEGGVAAAPAGFVERPPSQVSEAATVADDKPMSVPEGTFVINAAAVEFAGEADIARMLQAAYKKLGKQGKGAPSKEQIDVAVSRGEVIVPPAIAKIIGYDRLEKINNRGKAETNERIKENGQRPVGAAGGGFLTRKKLANGGEVDEYEDKIIAEEVRRKMDVLMDEVAARNFENKDDPITVISEYFKSDSAQKEYADAMAKRYDRAARTGNYFYNPKTKTLNVPKTPTLANLLVMAEEVAHMDAYEPGNPAARKNPYPAPEYSLFKDFNKLTGDLFRTPVMGEDFDPQKTFDLEGRYLEEMRAKQIAFQTVFGGLARRQAEQTKSGKKLKSTRASYEQNFADYITAFASPVVKAAFFKKYPNLKNVYREVPVELNPSATR